jgi:NAD-dependent SIR2 family protein deacetylase
MRLDGDAMTGVEWASGAATVVTIKGRFVVVRCPHCNGQHAHDRAVISSMSVVSGCSAPHHPREYSVINQRKRR